MKYRGKKSLIGLAILSVVSLSACNIELTSDGANVRSVNKTSTGVIEALGQLNVNGVTYDTSNASIITDGNEATENDLKLGMVVSVTGTQNDDGTGQAVVVEFEDATEGVVLENNSMDNNTLNVMGQIVHVDDNTVFESNENAIEDLQEIESGNIVEVSGYASGEGEIWATRVEIKKAELEYGDEMEVKGLVSNLTDSTFEIGDLTIEYENSMLHDSSDEMSENSASDGSVNGMSDDSITEMSEDLASDDSVNTLSDDSSDDMSEDSASDDSVNTLSDDSNDSNDEMSDDLASNDSVNELSDDSTSDSSFKELSDISAIGKLENGLYVEVSSRQSVNDSDRFVAERIEIKGDGNIEIKHANNDEEVEIKGRVTEVLSDNSIMLNGTLITLNNNAYFENGIRNNLTNGAMIEVEGYVDALGNFQAVKIEFENESDSNSDSDSDSDSDSSSSVASNSGIDTDFDSETDASNTDASNTKRPEINDDFHVEANDTVEVEDRDDDHISS